MPMIDNIGSIIFLWTYLSIIWIAVIDIWKRRKALFSAPGADTSKKIQLPKWWLYLLGAFVLLAFGDIFHLLPRTYLWIKYLQGNTNIYDSELGILIYGSGLIITGITMTFFYLMLFYFWKEVSEKYLRNRTNVNGKDGIKGSTGPLENLLQNKVKTLEWIAIGSVAIRIILILMPWNKWGTEPTYYAKVFSFRTLTNIPLYIIGFEIMYLFWITLKALKDSESPYKDIGKALLNSFYWMIVSYATYSATIFGVPINPLWGMMMIPKTIAYLVILYYMRKYILINKKLIEKLE